MERIAIIDMCLCCPSGHPSDGENGGLWCFETKKTNPDEHNFPDWCPLESLAEHDKRVRDAAIDDVEEALLRIPENCQSFTYDQFRKIVKKMKEAT